MVMGMREGYGSLLLSRDINLVESSIGEESTCEMKVLWVLSFFMAQNSAKE